MLRLIDLHAVESPLPDDRKDWRRLPPHSNTPDGETLAVVAFQMSELPGKFKDVIEKIDDIHKTAKDLFDSLSEDIQLQAERISALERNQERMKGYLIAVSVFATFLAPLAQSALKSWLHLP